MSTFVRWLRHMILILLTGIVGLISLGAGVAMPLFNLRRVNPGITVMMLSKGFLIHQSWKPLSHISKSLQQTVIAAEDGRFYEHEGVDWEEMQKSFEKDYRKKKFLRGSSTITMQLVKNLYLPRQKVLMRKGVEVLLALGMEKIVPKERILELYLNIIEWGPGIYGIEAASQYYFKKPSEKISHDEALFLAAIIPNPAKWGKWPPSRFVKKRESIIASRLGLHGPEKVAKPKVPTPVVNVPPSVPEPLPPELSSMPPDEPSTSPDPSPADAGTDEESDSLPPESPSTIPDKSTN